MSEIDVEALARHIAFRLDPDSLLDAEDVAVMLKVTPRYVTEQFAAAPGFPKAVRLTGPGGRRGKPRWHRADISRWIASHSAGATKLGGRPRGRTASPNLPKTA